MLLGKELCILTVLEKKKSTMTLAHITSFYKAVKDNKDDENAFKLVELFEKIHNNELVVSFAGHFSAGKSSMINKLLDHDILPKSPIPTSANIVKISSGKEAAKVFFHHEAPVEYAAPYDIELIKEYCKDKDRIKQIELITANSFLPKGSILIDTPGIDAADDADRLITESSLHLVDVLFYVMDYNHVQSEVNLYFLKNLQAKGIPFFVIINQVDKHNEEELLFSAFEKNIKQTFDQWDIYPQNIFYSSLTSPEVEHNQFQQIKQLLFDLLRSDKSTIIRTDESINHVIESHKKILRRETDEILASIKNDGVPETDIDKLASIEKKVASMKDVPENLNNQFLEELNVTLKNAYLMPADLRDKATSFLHSRQKGFKVGLFGAKRKTSEEKQERLDTFLHALQKSIDASIQWKLRDKLIHLLNENNITDAALRSDIQNLTIKYTAEDLFSHMKDGAQVNGNYVLNYTNDISADIKSKCRAQAQKLWRKIEVVLLNNLNEQIASYEEEKRQLQRALEWKQKKATIEDNLKQKLQRLDDTYIHPSKDETMEKNMKEIMEKRKATIQTIHSSDQVKKASSIFKKVSTKQKRNNKVNTQLSVEDVIKSIDKMVEIVEDIPMFDQIVNDLKIKQGRLVNRSITIALFGAFSAGKSSFANALFGENILPVSPNPTTAVINRVSPVTKEYKHGTVRIKLKDSETLYQDLFQITKSFSPPTKDFHSLLTWVQDNLIEKNEALNKMYQSYIEALITGFSELKNQIGKTMTISLDEFPAYVTDEAKACYFEEVTLYYDCSLTKQGIVLVDTPGADSINARHTNVAFDYIKYADAILYVTYYNHALSRADKDFLIQLGRVKEAFELDKMFFIINASDLAENRTDLQLVVQYVEEQLLELGIRFPKIFPLSSKRSLENKLKQTSLNEEMQQFESIFYQFINEDLAALMIESSISDMHRAVHVLNNYLETIHMDEQEKELYIKEINKKKELLCQVVDSIDSALYTDRIIERIDRQLHYVDERLAIRFHDMFTEHFNPTTVTESGRKAIDQLQQNLIHLIDYIGYELLQESRAVSLRLESRLRELTDEFYKQVKTECKSIEPSYILPSLDLPTFHTPAYEQAFSNIDMEIFKKSLGTFKGTKAFFEKNEKEVMKEDIYNSLHPNIKQYIKENKKLMHQSYVSQWDHLTSSLKQTVLENMETYFQNQVAMMTNDVNLEELKEKQQQLQANLDVVRKAEES